MKIGPVEYISINGAKLKSITKKVEKVEPAEKTKEAGWKA